MRLDVLSEIFNDVAYYFSGESFRDDYKLRFSTSYVSLANWLGVNCVYMLDDFRVFKH